MKKLTQRTSAPPAHNPAAAAGRSTEAEASARLRTPPRAPRRRNSPRRRLEGTARPPSGEDTGPRPLQGSRIGGLPGQGTRRGSPPEGGLRGRRRLFVCGGAFWRGRERVEEVGEQRRKKKERQQTSFKVPDLAAKLARFRCVNRQRLC